MKISLEISIEGMLYFITNFSERRILLWRLDHQLSLFVKNAKLSREKAVSELFVKIQNTNRDRANTPKFQQSFYAAAARRADALFGWF